MDDLEKFIKPAEVERVAYVERDVGIDTWVLLVVVSEDLEFIPNSDASTAASVPVLGVVP